MRNLFIVFFSLAGFLLSVAQERDCTYPSSLRFADGREVQRVDEWENVRRRE